MIEFCAKGVNFLSHFTGRDDYRKYLAGIMFMPAAAGGAYGVASNGVSLAIYHDEKGVAERGTIVNVTPDTVKACRRGTVLRAAPGLGGRLVVVNPETLEEHYVQPLGPRTAGINANAWEIEGEFPSVPRVLGFLKNMEADNRRTPGPVNYLSVKIMASIVAAARALKTGRTDGVRLVQPMYRDTVAVFFDGVPNALAIAMPMHGDEDGLIKPWVADFMAPAAKP